MQTKIILLDTCFFIDHLKGKTPETAEIFKQVSSGKITAGFSIITDVELWAGVRDKSDERRHKILLRDLYRYPLTVVISHQAGDLLQRYKKAGFDDPGDAIIAATALKYHLPVYTRNVKHFRLVPGLSVEQY
jgi:tRNA(fMet)-specific endonuclease VapC